MDKKASEAEITAERTVHSELSAAYQRETVYAMIKTEENERKRMSDSLHDSVIQLLYGIKMKLAKLVKTTPSTANIKVITNLVEEAINETRNISFELSPAVLTDFGLPATIEELAKRLSSRELKMKVNINGFFTRIDLLLEINIYRIVEQLVKNSIIHSGCSEISIEISNNKGIEIIVNDNGKGFKVIDSERFIPGSGLNSIKNRLRVYNGRININSEIDKGTSVHITLQDSLKR